jgi:hypothetical protein
VAQRYSVKGDSSLIYVEAGLRSHLEEQGLQLTLDPDKPPSAREKEVIGGLIQSLAKESKRPMEKLGSTQFDEVHVPAGGRLISLSSLYSLMAPMNDTGYATSFYIRSRFVQGTPKLPPFKKLTTLDQFKKALEAGALKQISWEDMHPKLQRRLVEELARQRKKPFYWLNDRDFATPLDGFTRLGKPFNLRTMLISAHDRHREEPFTVFALANELKMFGKTSQRVLPVKRLEEIRRALDKGWVRFGNFPWRLISDDVRRLMVADMAHGSGRNSKPLEKLNVLDFTHRPVPQLTFKDPVTKKKVKFTLRGLYDRYYRAGINLEYQGTAYLMTQLWPNRFETTVRRDRIALIGKAIQVKAHIYVLISLISWDNEWLQLVGWIAAGIMMGRQLLNPRPTRWLEVSA